MNKTRMRQLTEALTGDANKLSRILKGVSTVVEIDYMISQESNGRSRERILRRLIGKRTTVERQRLLENYL